MTSLHSIKVKLVFAITMLLVLVCIGFGLIVYNNTSKALIGHTEESLPIVAQQSAKTLESRINGIFLTLETIASQREVSNPDIPWEEKVVILAKEANRGSHKWMGIAGSDGILYTTEGNSTLIGGEEYFRQSLAGKNIVTEPMVNLSNKSVLIMYSVPIKYNDNIVGTLAAARDGYELCSLTSDITVGKSGKAFMIDNNGSTIAHINKDLVFSRYNGITAAEQDPTLKSLADIEKKMVKGELGSGRYTDNGNNEYLGYAPIKGTGWSIAVTAPEHEILDELVGMKRSIVTLSLSSLLSVWLWPI
ncbi:MAG: PDC sensor domain-containing protein [Clostridia bacterium]